MTRRRRGEGAKDNDLVHVHGKIPVELYNSAMYAKGFLIGKLRTKCEWTQIIEQAVKLWVDDFYKKNPHILPNQNTEAQAALVKVSGLLKQLEEIVQKEKGKVA